MSGSNSHQNFPKRLQPFVSDGWFESRHPDLIQRRKQVTKHCAAYNASPTPGHLKQLKSFLGKVEEGVFIEPGLYFDYGDAIELSKNVYINLDVIILDAAWVRIGEGTMIAPRVQLITVGHDRDPIKRREGLSFALPITIGENVWIGAGAIILPGVTIEDDAIVGAGAVVTRDVPRGETWVGNPAKKIAN